MNDHRSPNTARMGQQAQDIEALRTEIAGLSLARDGQDQAIALLWKAIAKLEKTVASLEKEVYSPGDEQDEDGGAFMRDEMAALRRQ